MMYDIDAILMHVHHVCIPLKYFYTFSTLKTQSVRHYFIFMTYFHGLTHDAIYKAALAFSPFLINCYNQGPVV